MPETSGAVLLALTGYGQERDRSAAMAAGFDHHLVKPVDLRQLQRILAEVSHQPRRGAGAEPDRAELTT